MHERVRRLAARRRTRERLQCDVAHVRAPVRECMVRLWGEPVVRRLEVSARLLSSPHAYSHDQENEQTYVALKHLGGEQGSFTVTNSHLSEFGTLGFELGYSLVSPNSLTIWEAQVSVRVPSPKCRRGNLLTPCYVSHGLRPMLSEGEHQH